MEVNQNQPNVSPPPSISPLPPVPASPDTPQAVIPPKPGGIKKIIIFLAVIILFAILGVGGVFAYKRFIQPLISPPSSPTPLPSPSLFEPPPSATSSAVSSATPSASPAKSKTGLKSYQSSQGFEIYYPEKLTLDYQQTKVFFIHRVPFNHTDPCNFVSGGKLADLTDFDITLELINKNLKDSLIYNKDGYLLDEYFKDDKLVLTKDYIEEVKIGMLSGYRIITGVEGCGESRYYFTLKPSQILFVSRKKITEFDPIVQSYQENLKIPGIIKPEEEGKIFNDILISFKLISS